MQILKPIKHVFKQLNNSKCQLGSTVYANPNIKAEIDLLKDMNFKFLKIIFRLVCAKFILCKTAHFSVEVC